MSQSKATLSIDKRLCKLNRRDIKANLSEIQSLVAEPRFVCQSCARASSIKKRLCKPTAISSSVSLSSVASSASEKGLAKAKATSKNSMKESSKRKDSISKGNKIDAKKEMKKEAKKSASKKEKLPLKKKAVSLTEGEMVIELHDKKARKQLKKWLKEQQKAHKRMSKFLRQIKKLASKQEKLERKYLRASATVKPIKTPLKAQLKQIKKVQSKRLH